MLRSARESWVTEPQPTYDVPVLPDDITEISDTALMNHLRQQIEWQNFFAAEVVKLELVEGQAEYMLKYEEASAYLQVGDFKTVTESKAARDHSPAVMEAAAEWFQAKIDRKAMQVVMESRERCAQLLSREITRRVGREPVQRRSDKWNP